MAFKTDETLHVDCVRLCFFQVQVLGGSARASCSNWRELRADAQETVSPPAGSLPRRCHKGAAALLFLLCTFHFSSAHFLIVLLFKYPLPSPCPPSTFLPFPLRTGQLFLKEDVYQLLECKRERTRQLAALTLQRYARMFFIRKRFLAFRKKIVTLQAQCRGFLTRSARPALAVSGSQPSE